MPPIIQWISARGVTTWENFSR